MSLTEQLRRGASYPNLDIELELGIDLTTKQYCAVLISSDLLGLAPSAPFAPPYRIAGILQNAPTAEQKAIVRRWGWSSVRYGDTVADGDLLKTETSGSYDRLVPFVMGTDGHNHAANNALMESVLVRVTDLSGVTGVTGLDATDITARQWFLGGSGNITEEPASTTVLEATSGDGWYVITTTTISNLDLPHRLSIEAVDQDAHLITPSEYQWTPRNNNFGPPVGLTYVMCMGQALISGVADDFGLMIVCPQLF